MPDYHIEKNVLKKIKDASDSSLISVVDINSLLYRYALRNGLTMQELLSGITKDTIHPNSVGFKLYANIISPMVDE